MIYQWNYVPAPAGEEAEGRRLAEELGMHPVFGRMLRERCIYTAAEARRFFRPQLTDLHDPFLMNDMQIAVERLNKAILRKERIMVYGDYDVDGVTSVALVYRFISHYYNNIDYYIPDRYDEGYGVSKRGIDYAAETGVRLIIVLDCGIKAVDEIAYAKERGIELLLPVDTVVAPEFAADAPATVVPSSAIPADQMGLDIGPETRKLFADAIATSKTVVWNGPMGVFEFPAFAEGTKAVAKAISESDAFSVIGGGDSAAAVRTLGFDEATFSHISTGGGASLELLEGKTLPGIAVLND